MSILHKMVLYEIRGGSKPFLLFLACLSLGTASIATISSFSDTMEYNIHKRAKSLLGGDIEIKSNSPLKKATMKILTDLKGRGIDLTTVKELAGMAIEDKNGTTQLVEIKALEKKYPFYGKLITDPETDIQEISSGEKIFVEESLLITMGLNIGGLVNIGDSLFTVAAKIKSEPDRIAGAFSLGPRVLMSIEGLAKANLVQPGSRVRYRYLLKLPDSINATTLVKELDNLISDVRIRIKDFHKAQSRIRRFFENFTTYLALIGTISLIIGGIGVAISIQIFIKKKMDSIAIMKCLGATSKQIITVYVTLILLLAIAGGLIGTGIGFGGQQVLHMLIADLLPFDIMPSTSYRPVITCLAVSIIISLLFSISPLLSVRSVPPAILFLRDVDERPFFKSKKDALGILLVTLVVIQSIILWFARSFKLGFTVGGVLCATALLLYLFALFIMYRVKKISPSKHVPVRIGLASLYRPGNNTKVAVLTIGLISTLIITLSLVKMALSDKIQKSLPVEAPTFFFIDIQKDQTAPFQELLISKNLKVETFPTARGRLHSINGNSVRDLNIEGRKDGWYFRREYVLTYQPELSLGNTVIKGEWWTDSEYTKKNIVSIDSKVAQALNLSTGSSLTLDIQGQLVEAVVGSIRKIDWSTLRPNFYLIFTEKALAPLSTTFIATTRTEQVMDVPIQRSITKRFPNITSINVRNIMTSLNTTLLQLSTIINVMSFLGVAVGFMVLSGIIAVSRYERMKETTICKVLGATSISIIKIMSVEYCILGFIAGTISAFMSSLLSYIVLTRFMKLSWFLRIDFLLIAIVCVSIFTVFAGFLSTWTTVRKKPLHVLRSE